MLTPNLIHIKDDGNISELDIFVLVEPKSAVSKIQNPPSLMEDFKSEDVASFLRKRAGVMKSMLATA